MFNAISLPLEVIKFEYHPFMTSTKNDQFCDKFQDPIPLHRFCVVVINVWLGTFNYCVITKWPELEPRPPSVHTCSILVSPLLQSLKTLRQLAHTPYKSSQLWDFTVSKPALIIITYRLNGTRKCSLRDLGSLLRFSFLAYNLLISVSSSWTRFSIK